MELITDDWRLTTTNSSQRFAGAGDLDGAVVGRDVNDGVAGADFDAALALVEVAGIATQIRLARHGRVTVGANADAGAVVGRQVQRERPGFGGGFHASAVPGSAPE